MSLTLMLLNSESAGSINRADRDPAQHIRLHAAACPLIPEVPNIIILAI